MTSLAPLQHLFDTIREKLDVETGRYLVPGKWIAFDNDQQAVAVHPYSVWANGIGRILKQPATPLEAPDSSGGSWTRTAHTYNLFVRSSLAFDHDNDGVIGRPNADNLSETGTFTKAILLLPYIKSLGCNTVHLLPITSIGSDGNKGNAGSPYAIRNQYRIDENLAEPSLGLGVEAEFAAFVAAAHHLGIRVVLEFVLRTSSKDGDDIKDHPEWFYWIDSTVRDRQPGSDAEDAYGMPVFNENELNTLKAQVEAGDFNNLPAPHQIFRDMFLPAPRPEDVHMRDGKWVAEYPDGRTGRIPGAFADYPPDDNQPPWGDVTYLRLYDHPDFNYIAYNTIRMYDTRLATPENAVEPLWSHIANIIPHYQTNFGIDGAMIDMGHALPMSLKQRIIDTARGINSNFAFWDENFTVAQKSVDEGYNAVMGKLAFMLYKPDEFKWWLGTFMVKDAPLPMFGAIENHNLPRAASRTGGTQYSRTAFSIASFLPTKPFVHSGMEFGETMPVNTGLDFTNEMLKDFSAETLPLFSAAAYNWTNGDPGLTYHIRKTLALRKRFLHVITDHRADTMGPLTSDNPMIQGILRRTMDWSTKIALIINYDRHNHQTVWIPLPTGRAQLMDHYTSELHDVSNSWLHAKLAPGQVAWYEL